MFKKRTAGLHHLIANICLGGAILCLGTAYMLAGDWAILPVIVGMIVLWMYVGQRSVFWSASSVLFACALLAAIGITIHLSFLLMVLGCTASLAYWDLTNFRHSIPASFSSPQEVSLEKHHLRSLAIANFTGLLLVSVGLFLDLHISFFFTIVLALTVVGCLTYGVWSILQDR